MKKRSLLLVEDEAAISAPLARILVADGFAVTVAASVQAAKQAMVGACPDLVILDWTLPDGQGIELLRAWRKTGNEVPIVLLTARADVIDKVLALELGADDYMTKPFEARELLARIHVRLRQKNDATAGAATVLTHVGISLDDAAHRVTYQGREVDLARMEYALLKVFLENVGRVFSRDELLNRVWGFDAYPTTRTVDTHVLQLRQKFLPELIETVRGIGYRMKLTED